MGASPTYTANGELASKTDTATGEATTYQYDVLGSLLRVDLPDGRVIEYVVDGRGRRVARKVDGAVTKRWLYRDQLNPVAELDGAGALTWQYVYGSKPNVPDYAIRVSDGARYRIVSDQLGSVVLVVNVDDAGDVLFAGRYSAFGEQEVIRGSAEWGAFGFAGGRYDEDTALVRFGARDYDPTTGRWTGKDPVRWGGGQANLYAYVVLNPVNQLDRTGRDGTWVSYGVEWVWGGGGGVDRVRLFPRGPAAGPTGPVTSGAVGGGAIAGAGIGAACGVYLSSEADFLRSTELRIGLGNVEIHFFFHDGGVTGFGASGGPGSTWGVGVFDPT